MHNTNEYLRNTEGMTAAQRGSFDRIFIGVVTAYIDKQTFESALSTTKFLAKMSDEREVTI